MGSKDSVTRREIEIELKGKKYTIRELRLKEYGDAENFIRSMHVDLYRNSAEGVDPDKIEETVAKMIRAPYTPEELGEIMASPSCSEFVVYLSLRHNEGVTRENISEIVDLTNVSEVNEIIQALQGEDEDESPPETAETKP